MFSVHICICIQCNVHLVFLFFFFSPASPLSQKARIMSLRGLFSSPTEAQDTQFYYPTASLTFRKRETWQNETSVNM